MHTLAERALADYGAEPDEAAEVAQILRDFRFIFVLPPDDVPFPRPRLTTSPWEHAEGYRVTIEESDRSLFFRRNPNGPSLGFYLHVQGRCTRCQRETLSTVCHELADVGAHFVHFRPWDRHECPK